MTRHTLKPHPGDVWRGDGWWVGHIPADQHSRWGEMVRIENGDFGAYLVPSSGGGFAGRAALNGAGKRFRLRREGDDMVLEIQG